MRHGVDSDLDIGVLYRQRQPVVAPLSLRGEPTLRYRQRQAVSRSCPALLRRHEPQNAVVVRGGRAATVPIARGEIQESIRADDHIANPSEESVDQPFVRAATHSWIGQAGDRASSGRALDVRVEGDNETGYSHL